MNGEIERLFAEALEIPPARRAEFLAENCADAALRREVELLLKHDEGAEAFLAGAVSGEAASVMQLLLLSRGQRLGPYSVLSAIGYGGMGIVYLAERADGKFEQRVAIKLVQAGLDGAFAERLQQECRILATLDHPNIARLLDAGATDDGLPYFVMEYVAGQPIDCYCDEHHLTPRDRVKLMLPVCAAVQLAHQKLVVHRDLKPDNILVTAAGIPKLLDFGIAKVLDDAPAGSAPVTRVLTPEYGSPEQVRGESVSTAADIYALGGVLYKLLTGVTPHQIEGRSPADTLRAICEEDVRRPSSLRPELDGDLDHILQMALRKEPQRRYSSAEQFAADLQRWLAGRPVLASPNSIWYRSGKFMRRHWLGAAASAIVVLALVAGTAVALWQARRAERRFADVRHLANVFLFDFEQSIHQLPGATKARQLLVKTALEYLRSLSREAGGDTALTRELAAAYEKVGDIQAGNDSGGVDDAPGAVRSYQQVISLLKSLQRFGLDDTGLSSSLAQVWGKLGDAQIRTRQLKAAVASFEQSAAIGRRVLETRPTDRAANRSVADAYGTLAFLDARDPRAAMDYAQRGLELRKSVADQTPQDINALISLADGYASVGSLCEMLERGPAEAAAYYQKALPIDEKLSALDPSNAELQRKLMVLLGQLGDMQLRAARNPRTSYREPLAHLRTAYAMAENAVTRDPADTIAVQVLAAMCARLGEALGVLGRTAEGERVMQRAVQTFTGLAQRDQSSGENRLDLGKIHSQFADFLAKYSRIPDAMRHLQIAADIFAKMAQANPADSKSRLLQVWNFSSLAELSGKQGDWAEARHNYALGQAIAQQFAPQDPAFAKALAQIQQADAHAVQMLASGR
ncbi:MAG TPA: protein kinase [Bryobacteraceae bacterium]|nr:protein kinase [Bryobacteraceae bacterium]